MAKMNNKFHTFLWIVATIFEVINIILFFAAMGYEFDIPLYKELYSFKHKAMVYYISAGVDIGLFGLLTYVGRAKKDVKNTLLALYCFLIQIALLIYKVKL